MNAATQPSGRRASRRRRLRRWREGIGAAIASTFVGGLAAGVLLDLAGGQLSAWWLASACTVACALGWLSEGPRVALNGGPTRDQIPNEAGQLHATPELSLDEDYEDSKR